MSCATPFPRVIDASMRSTYADCQRKFYWQYIRQIRLKSTGIHLHAGACFAAGLDRARRAFHVDGASEARAVFEGVKSVILTWGNEDEAEGYVKSLDRVCGALLDYFCEYPLATDFLQPKIIGNEPMFEFSAGLPLSGTEHPLWHEPIIYGGRWDMVGEYEGGIYIDDEKTTTQLGDSWLRKWDLRGQFLGYMWLARSFGVDAAGVIVRGISFLKNSYGHAQVPVQFAPWQVDEYIEHVVEETNEMAAKWVGAAGGMTPWRKNFSEACTAYGGCPYARLCTKENPEDWVPIDFEHSEWNPLRQMRALPGTEKANAPGAGQSDVQTAAHGGILHA